MSDDLRLGHVRCYYGRCRTRRGLPRRTLHFVLDVQVNGKPMVEAHCTGCRQKTYTDPSTGDVWIVAPLEVANVKEGV